MLTAEWSVCEFHVVWSLDMCVGKGKGLVIPGVVSVLVARSKVDNFGSVFWLSKTPSNELIVSLALKNNGDRLRQINL